MKNLKKNRIVVLLIGTTVSECHELKVFHKRKTKQCEIFKWNKEKDHAEFHSVMCWVLNDESEAKKQKLNEDTKKMNDVINEQYDENLITFWYWEKLNLRIKLE